MKSAKILMLGCLLASTAGAVPIPLLGSKASVAEGNFCKTYGCKFVSKTVVAPETLYHVIYRYSLNNGGELVVSRHSEMTIMGAEVYGLKINSQMVTDFTRSFLGFDFNDGAFRGCASATPKEDVVVASGPAKTDTNKYELWCTKDEKGRQGLWVTDAMEYH